MGQYYHLLMFTKREVNVLLPDGYFAIFTFSLEEIMFGSFNVQLGYKTKVLHNCIKISLEDVNQSIT